MRTRLELRNSQTAAIRAGLRESNSGRLIDHRKLNAKWKKILAAALAVSRREGYCIQVLLPYSLDQNEFGTGGYLAKRIYRRQWMPNKGFIYEQSPYEPACGDAYFFARSIVKAP